MAEEEVFDDREALGDVHAAIEAGKRIGTARVIEANKQLKYLILPEGFESQPVEADPQPKYIRARVGFHDAASFAGYFNDFKSPASRIFLDLTKQSFRAVLDYHSTTEPGRGCHTAVYACPQTVEWKTWTANDRKVKSQAEFGQFIEENMPDISVPVGSTVLEMTRTLTGKKEATFLQGVRLSDGQTQFRYEEEITAGAGQQGSLAIPELIVLGLRPFEGSPAYKVEARFRWRIKEGALTMWYELVRTHGYSDLSVFNDHH